MSKEKTKRPRGRPIKSYSLGDTQVFNVRLQQQLYDRLHDQAEKENRDMAYLVRVFVQAGLDDRAKMATGGK